MEPGVPGFPIPLRRSPNAGLAAVAEMPMGYPFHAWRADASPLARLCALYRFNWRAVVDARLRQARLVALPRNRLRFVDCVYRSDPSSEMRGLAATSRYPEGFATWFGDFDDVIIRVQQ